MKGTVNAGRCLRIWGNLDLRVCLPFAFSIFTDPKDPESMTKNMWDFAEEDWKLMYDVNVISLWYMTVAFLPFLQRTHEEHLKPE